MSVMQSIGNALKEAAPGLATALMGPAGGVVAKMALNAVSKAAGMPGAKPNAVLKAVKEGAVDPGMLAKEEADFQVRMKELDVDLERVYAEDRESARNMRVALGGDLTSSVLAYLAIALFGGVVGVIMWMAANGTVIPSATKELIIFILGHASGFASSVYLYFFGASKGAGKGDAR